MIASIIAKLLTVVARWPNKLIAPPNPPKFKELDAPALLGRLKRKVRVKYVYKVKKYLYRVCKKKTNENSLNIYNVALQKWTL